MAPAFFQTAVSERAKLPARQLCWNAHEFRLTDGSTDHLTKATCELLVDRHSFVLEVVEGLAPVSTTVVGEDEEGA